MFLSKVKRSNNNIAFTLKLIYNEAYMATQFAGKRNNNRKLGFTIVELLIVIVVIGILAAITIVAYNGVKLKAVDATVRTDLATSARLLANDLTVNGNYPATTSAANSGKGLPSGSGTVYVYTVNNASSPQSYTLTGSNSGSSNTYGISNVSTSPTLVVASTPPTISSPASNTAFNTDGCGSAPAYFSFWLYSTGTGTPTPTVQWQRMTPINTAAGSWTNISGATTANYSFNGTGILQFDGDYDYFRAIYTNTGGSTTSPTLKVTITNGC
jgi:general secretion pathway protein G